MATRPVFISELAGAALVRLVDVDFVWHAGMSKSQKQKSIRSLHDAVSDALPTARLLEVSSASEDKLGEGLSAFNLTFDTKRRGRTISVECAFQSSKVFENGGPYLDLLDTQPLDAKRDPRLQNSGRLTGFRFFGEEWPLEPLTAFYDWVYIHALHQRKALADAAMEYDAFTDIAFNPDKSINCQAGAVALYVSLRRRSLLDHALRSREDYLETIAGLDGHGVRAEGEAQGRLL